MCVKSMAASEGTYVVHTTTERFFPTHGWIPCTGVGAVVFRMYLWNTTGAFQSRPGIQFAVARPNLPGTPTGVGTAVSLDGPHRYGTTPSVSGQFYMRFGLMCSLKTGTTEAYGNVSLEPTFHDCGVTLPMSTITLNPGDGDTSVPMVFPITAPQPTVGISGAKLAITIENNANTDLQYKQVARVFTTTDEPGTWVDMDGVTFTTPAAGNSDSNAGELAFPAGLNVSSQVFVQLGLAIRRATATDLRAILRIQPALIY